VAVNEQQRNYTAYAAVTSIAVTGLYIAYVMPAFRELPA
jgi:hypothetical protein